MVIYLFILLILLLLLIIISIIKIIIILKNLFGVVVKVSLVIEKLDNPYIMLILHTNFDPM